MAGQPATCMEYGFEEYWICHQCGRMFSDAEGTNEIFEPVQTEFAEHNLEYVEIIAPTCSTAGLGYWWCDHCGIMFADAEGTIEIFEPFEIPMLEHDVSDWVIIEEATFTTEGYMCRYCNICGAVVEEQTIAKLVDEQLTATYYNMINAIALPDKYIAIVAFRPYLDVYTTDQLGMYYAVYVELCMQYEMEMWGVQQDIDTAENVASSIVKLATVLASLSGITACACLRKWY